MSSPQAEWAAKAGKHLRNRILSGVMVLVPLAITVLAMKLLYDFITAAGLPLVRPWLGDISPAVLSLIAAATMVVLVYVAGLITTFLPEEDIEQTDISIEAGLKMLVSGGVIAPDRYARPSPAMNSP